MLYNNGSELYIFSYFLIILNDIGKTIHSMLYFCNYILNVVKYLLVLDKPICKDF